MFSCPSRQILKVLIFLILSGGAGSSWAYLGGFEEDDGYRVSTSGNIASQNHVGDAQFYLQNNAGNGLTGIVPSATYPNNMGDNWHGPDVSRYNAGQYGWGVGGTATDIADNTGRWRALAGGRLNEDIGAPVYLGGEYQRDYISAYNYLYARSGNQSLAILAYDEDLLYSYSLDSRDFGGIDPATTSDMRIDLTFWTRPTDADDSMAVGINTVAMSFRDSIGQILVDIGYTGDNLLQYRLAGSALWQTTTLALGTTDWSEIHLTLDTGSSIVSLSARAFNDQSGILGTTTAVLTDEALGFNADSVTGIEWSAKDVEGFENYFDDFSFSLSASLAPVPEPGTLLLVVLGALVMMRRRRRLLPHPQG